jgi:hypothetical protein
MPKPIKIFISYSHDSTKHQQWVLRLSNRLREQGLDCQLDQYINGFPPQGWQRWMEKQIEQADFVLIICTPLYLQRYKGEAFATGLGKGVNFEGVVISQSLYDCYYRNTKFIPVIPDNGSHNNIPLPLKAYSSYQLMDDYQNLYRVLTAQPAISAPKLGQRQELPPHNGDNKAENLSNGKTNSANLAKHWMLKSSYLKTTMLISILLIAIIVGLLAFWGGAKNTTTGDCSGVFTGDINGNLNLNCGQDQPSAQGDKSK